MTAIALKGRFVSPIIPALIEQLIKEDRVRLGQQLSQLIEANTALSGSPIGFMFAGEFHSLYDKSVQAKAAKKPLHPSLMNQGNDYITELKRLKNDCIRMQSGLSLLLRPCESWQDVRDALPDAVKDELPEIRSLPRTRPEGWTLEAFPLQRHQIQITIDLMLFYIANRLLY